MLVACALLAGPPAPAEDAALASGNASSADGPLIDPGLPPRINDWIPLSWWSPVRFAEGRLNADPYVDLAVLLERKQDAPEDRRYARGSRALLVLYGLPGGSWRRGPLIPGMLPCASCSDTLGGGRESELYDLSISADGVLEIAWIHKRAGIKSVRLFIGWDTGYDGLGLLADDIAQIQPVSHGRTRVRRDYRAGIMWVDGEPRSMPPRFIPIEDVSAAQY